MTIKPFFENDQITLFDKDCRKTMSELPECSVDLIFADPPYRLSNGGITCKNGKVASVNKANWDKSKGLHKDFEFAVQWIKEARRILKEDGSIWISGTHHNIYRIGFVLQKLGFKILNEITWFKPNAPPNLSCRYFTHSHESVIWARKNKKSKHTFNYEKSKLIYDRINKKNKQTRSVWDIPLTPKSEKSNGKHPTQKPIELLRRIIIASSNKGDLILDPFNGSGTTGVVASKLGRNYIGIDNNKEYLELSLKRMNVV